MIQFSAFHKRDNLKEMFAVEMYFENKDYCAKNV